ncbi:MAG: glycosyltransferase family 4 protein [Acidimicrobiia bacterium]|nr:glycosyltransferase family 4 protein [Acidimicrobiia bacterium]
MTLSVIRHGTFSGSGTSLIEAMRPKVPFDEFDVHTLARSIRVLPARFTAKREARRAGDNVPFSKTAAWTSALQRVTDPHLLSGTVLFIQSIGAFSLDPSVRYGIYTDRLGQEGLAAEGKYQSRATPEWVEREAAFVNGAYRLFVMGPTTKEFALEHYDIGADRIIVVGGAPNAPLGDRSASTSCDRFLFAGIEWRRKGLPDLLEAFAALREQYPNIELDVVGGEPPGPHPAGVNVFGRVPHDEMQKYFSRADALVIPTYVEPFGIALVEALMTGLPVIGTTVGNQEWIMGTGGLAIEPGDVHALTKAMSQMIDDYPTMRQRADERREELMKTMTWERIADRILSELVEGYPQ